ncbi:HNH endonuclease [Salmonella enterica subsp. enterica serovar Brandenburg]|nr:HNH endonuclease [Salmonella enterica subsp. enterica serovar Nima]EDS7029610.1 HNH endonuclease [Salmonella enterica subsp. enterica]EIR7526294.1 HNH endonuclease [Salmonella enterica subsp. enterica serovar Brandenburg]EBX3165350.1 HNH endonuclease [Salmonella enterica subsp. enterica serovar Nima]ECD6552450.1 HNH endonuclease [Salmonella enterica subsp. enterica serovar Nima]
MALTRKQRERLRMKFGGRCAYCGCVLPEKGWHADHVQAVLRMLKTTYSLEMFRKQVSLQVERGRRSSVNFRTAERFRLISVVNKPVVFWFEQYEGGE